MRKENSDSVSVSQEIKKIIAALVTLWVLAVLLLAVTAQRVRAQEVILQEEPTPSSVNEITTPIEHCAEFLFLKFSSFFLCDLCNGV